MKELKIKNAKLKNETVEGRGPRDEGNAKSTNREICEQGKEVGLVELVPPMEERNASGADNRGRGRERGRGGLRAELVAVLEGCGVSVAGFDGLRCDTYEKHLAGRSLVELAAFYRRLLNPSEGYESLQKQCLPWSEPSKYCGKLPSVKTLTEIKERLQLEQAVRDRLKTKKLIKARKKGTAKDDGEEYFREAVEMLAEELLSAKVDGKPISENLKVMDRLLRAAALRLRERKEARAAARFDWERVGKPIAEVVPEYDPEAEARQNRAIDEMMERMYGVNPYKKTEAVEEPEGTADQAGLNMNNEGAKTQSEEIKFQNPNSKQSNAESGVRSAELKAEEQAKADNREIGEPAGKKPEASVTLDPTAPKEPEKEPVQPIDTRPEWAKKPGNLLIGGPSKWHPMGVKKYKNKPVDAATGAIIRDMSWCSFIGFGGDGEKQLD